MNNEKWFFGDETYPNDKLVDEFADSKFGIDKWSSFAREIIQNSLDAHDDTNTNPVEVCFDLNKNLSIYDIPGCNELKKIIEKCISNATNKHTINAYKKGLEILNKDKIYCLKISDKNTIGVKSGRDNDWGALVFDEGRSIKKRPGSAGSHGVGKKAPFIISSCRSVFYATKNKYKNSKNEEVSDCLVQGKAVLINWIDDNGKRKCKEGWFGIENIEAGLNDKNKILPIDPNKTSNVNPYFCRKEETGTDVIIIGANLYENEKEIIQEMISAVLENFYVAIIENKLIVNIFGIEINGNNITSIFETKYRPTKDFKGSLRDDIDVYLNAPDHFVNIDNSKGEMVGKINIKLQLGNERDRKYYSIVRSHGMRIEERNLKTDQPFSCVVFVDGELLNDQLSKLENAAHDKFVDVGEEVEDEKEAIFEFHKIREIVKDYIHKNTTINGEDTQNIEGLSEIISIEGLEPIVEKREEKVRVKRVGVIKKGGTGEEGEGGNKIDTKERKKKKKKKKKRPGEKDNANTYYNYKEDPVYTVDKKDNTLINILFSTQDYIKDAIISVRSINSEDKIDDSILSLIEDMYFDDVKYSQRRTGTINGIEITENNIHKLSIKLKKKTYYKLNMRIINKENNRYE